MTPALIVVADSVTALPAQARGAVLVTGSHGGLVAARYASSAGVRSAMFNDAGRGKDDAGIAGIVALDDVGMAAAAVAHTSARIADAADTLARGIVSFVNAHCAALGVVAGLRCDEAAERLRRAEPPSGRLPPPRESRVTLVERRRGQAAIVGLDSIGAVEPQDAGTVLVIGSHGALHGRDPASALRVAAAGAFFHDAGGGCEDAGYSRLPVLDGRGIAAATVDHRSARIGDARSMWMTGMLSRVNGAAASRGISIGMRVDEAARRMASGL